MRWIAMIAGVTLIAGCASEASDSSNNNEQDGVESAEDMLSQIGEEPTGAKSKHAIVLAHGFDASDSNRWSFNGVKEALERDGHTVHAARVQPYQSVAKRAAELSKHVDQARTECAARAAAGCDASKVHILAHSMGGLDSRYVVAKLSNPEGVPYKKLVASVTMISTPHRGSAIADKILSITPGAADPVLNTLAGLWARTFTDSDLAADSDVRAALVGISEGNAESFNSEIQNASGVYYQSWAGITSHLDLHIDQKEIDACEGKVASYRNRHDRLLDHDPVSSAQLQASAPIVGHGLGNAADPNDGMVTVKSAKWGKFMGCIPADHMDEVGQRNGSDRPALWSRFDHIRFYRQIAYGLDRASGSVTPSGGER
jgi:triacylglycerol lipase